MSGSGPAATPSPARKRGPARLAAVQALYQIQQGEHSVEEVVDQFLEVRARETGEGGMAENTDRDFFSNLVHGAATHRGEIDGLIEGALSAGWTLARVDRLAKAMLQAGVYELRYRVDVPARVVINEYVELAHDFYGEREPAFINSILDRLARSLRGAELKDAAHRGNG
jgi:transcription antitermination protein NusB